MKSVFQLIYGQSDFPGQTASTGAWARIPLRRGLLCMNSPVTYPAGWAAVTWGITAGHLVHRCLNPVALPRASASALGLVGCPGCTGQAKPSATFAGDLRRRFPASCIDRRLTRRRESSVFQASGKRRKPGKQDLGRIGHLTRFSLSNGPIG